MPAGNFQALRYEDKIPNLAVVAVAEIEIAAAVVETETAAAVERLRVIVCR